MHCIISETQSCTSCFKFLDKLISAKTVSDKKCPKRVDEIRWMLIIWMKVGKMDERLFSNYFEGEKR